MDFLVLSPPVCTPAEPPSGAFLLAAGLAGHGYEVGLLDLSLELLHRVLEDPSLPGPGPELTWAMRLLLTADGYDPLAHRSATGVLHKKLKGFAWRHPGWRLSLMDLVAPRRVHDPEALAGLLEHQSPFGALWEAVLAPALERHRPRRVLVSLAYLSQLAAGIDLVRFLASRGIDAVVGGSLPRSMARTARGLEALRRVLPGLELGDGSSLIPGLIVGAGRLLDALAWPALLSPRPYLSCRPIIPLALSTGCYWNRCLFCPDRDLPYQPIPLQALDALLEDCPAEVRERRPLVHLLDSAMPPALLRRFLPIARRHQVRFYGFARPTRPLMRRGLLEEAAESGCAMLQLGAEGGSQGLLDRFDKGIDPAVAGEIARAASALGVRTYLYLLFGLPGEGSADREATLRWMVDHADHLDFVNLSVFNLPRDTELTRRAADFGLTLEDFPEPDPLRLYRPFTCEGVSPRHEARRFLRERLHPHPALRPMMLRTPRWLRAAHLALMRLPGRRW